MVDTSITLYPGDQITIAVATGQAAEDAPNADGPLPGEAADPGADIPGDPAAAPDPEPAAPADPAVDTSADPTPDGVPDPVAADPSSGAAGSPVQADPTLALGVGAAPQ